LPLPVKQWQHHFGAEWRFQLGRNDIYIYASPTVVKGPKNLKNIDVVPWLCVTNANAITRFG